MLFLFLMKEDDKMSCQNVNTDSLQDLACLVSRAV